MFCAIALQFQSFDVITAKVCPGIKTVKILSEISTKETIVLTPPNNQKVKYIFVILML
jgi:hypothetical protein